MVSHPNTLKDTFHLVVLHKEQERLPFGRQTQHLLH
jgi:hypothetical protein